MTVQQLIEILQSNGWGETTASETCRSLKHEPLRRTVTISGKLESEVPPAVLRTVKRYAQLQE